MRSIKPEILTFSGHYFNFVTPWKSKITIEDIAHGLSQICRFTGQCLRFYSVAQHCVHVSKLVPSEFARQGLMHDAHECFMGDVSSPLKRLLPDFKKIEHRVEAVVLAKFGLPFPLDPCVKVADLKALATEKRDVMSNERKRGSWAQLQHLDADPKNQPPLGPKAAERLFLRRYEELFL